MCVIIPDIDWNINACILYLYTHVFDQDFLIKRTHIRQTTTDECRESAILLNMYLYSIINIYSMFYMRLYGCLLYMLILEYCRDAKRVQHVADDKTRQSPTYPHTMEGNCAEHQSSSNLLRYIYCCWVETAAAGKCDRSRSRILPRHDASIGYIYCTVPTPYTCSISDTYPRSAGVTG